jgi:biotin carboxyl carrier protein
MKMENEIHSHRDGIVSEVSVEPGQQVAQDDVICLVQEA